MKKILISILFLIAVAHSAFAQSLQDIFALIEQNNLSLKTYSARCNAAKLEARTGTALADPEVEFGYLWGTPNGIGNRKDFSVTQSFDFATVFGVKRREAQNKEQLADLECEQARNLVFFAAQQLAIDLTCVNKKLEEQKARLASSVQLENSYLSMFQKGEVSKIDVSRVQLSHASAEAELQSLMIEKESLQSKLSMMCADEENSTSIVYDSNNYPAEHIKGDRSVSVSKQEVDLASQQVAAAKAEGMPELKAGYMSELTPGEKFRGITVGVSIPLWKNRNNTARAKAQQLLAQTATDELTHQLSEQRKELQSKAQRLHALLKSLRSSLSSINTLALMQKALEAGEISLIDYINERSTYYELQDKFIETEHEYQTAIAELSFISAE